MLTTQYQVFGIDESGNGGARRYIARTESQNIGNVLN